MSMAEITFRQGPVHAEIVLPASKSISNRALIIRAIGGFDSAIYRIAESADTKQLNAILSQPLQESISAGEGGTTSRFLLAYLAAISGMHKLTVSGTMKNRPVGTLVTALSDLGAIIKYEERDGFFPVTIQGGNLSGNRVTIPGEISSQFVSALMMIGPVLKGGLQIQISGELVSQPYIAMTKSIMQFFGAHVEWNNNEINIPEGKYSAQELTVEADWSAASYWYEIAALSDEASIRLKGLTQKSLQGDSMIASMMEEFGVQTEFEDDGVLITKTKGSSVTSYFEADFSGCPDLAPAIAVTCSALGVKADLHGLKNFRLKESDRASALQRELYRFGVKTDFCGGSKFKVYDGHRLVAGKRPVNTYGDHRIAMAMAPLAMSLSMINISEPNVVSKSYPLFYKDLAACGFDVRIE